MGKDVVFDIAVGASAKSKSWKNKKMAWGDFVEKLSRPVVTGETLKEYKAFSRDDKSKVKDVGGYVGGYLSGARRKPDAVLHRQILTLDLDFAPHGIMDDLMLDLDFAFVIHSTHSHSKEQAKYRLLVLLDEEVSPAKYEAIGRKIAGDINIEYFDETGFQPFRLMFWPSCSKDANYEFYENEGDPLNTQDVLDSYVDWRDVSSHPTTKDVFQEVAARAKKQKDPLTKAGMVGAFCRTYDIHEAISTFLQNEYKEEPNDRYTYLKGSTSSGLVTYDDKFAFSHHGTDPTGGTLCNAFDLVRVHRFGYLDKDSTVKIAKNKPSYKEMEVLCQNDKQVKMTIGRESLAAVKYDFEDELEVDLLLADVDKSNDEWLTELEVDAKGNYLSSENNINIIFQHDPILKDCFKYNEFDSRKYVCKTLPWRKYPISTPEPIRDLDFSGLRNYIGCRYKISASSKIEDALSIVFEKGSYHPVRDYLNSLEWDGLSRVDYLLPHYLGAEENEYTRQAMRKTLCAAVARIYNPGVKFDLVLTLVGPQGNGKSTFIRTLANGWSSDSFNTVVGKESFEQLHGSWLIEIAELAGFRRSEAEAVKHFISKQEDIYRPAYGRTLETYKRQCVFIGTTNKVNFLSDPSGNRRFLPVVTNPENAEADIREISDEELAMVWAEAKYLWENGEELYLDESVRALAKEKQESHREIDARVGIIQEYLERKLPDNWDELSPSMRYEYLNDPLAPNTGTERTRVCSLEIWTECFGNRIKDLDVRRTRDLNNLLRSVPGWGTSGKQSRFKHYGKQRLYEKSTTV